MKARLLPITYFVWIVVPVALFIAYLAFGLPHVIWSYSFLDNGRGNDPFVERHYTRCTFIGPYGSFTTHPADGTCPWFRFFKEKQEQLSSLQSPSGLEIQLVGRDQLQPRRWHLALQVATFGQFHNRNRLQYVEHGQLSGFTAGDLPVAMVAWLQDQVIGRDRHPKTLVVHRFKPGFNLIYVFELSHLLRIPEGDSTLQEQSTKEADHDLQHV